MLLCVVVVGLFVLLSNNSLPENILNYLSVLLLVDIWVVRSSFFFPFMNDTAMNFLAHVSW